MKILVVSIRFVESSEFSGILGNGTPVKNRALCVELNTRHTITIEREGGRLRFTTDNPLGTITPTELKVARLVYDACWNWLNYDQPESMDTGACIDAETLALERIDWAANGYDPDGDDTDKYITLCGYISHYEDF